MTNISPKFWGSKGNDRIFDRIYPSTNISKIFANISRFFSILSINTNIFLWSNDFFQYSTLNFWLEIFKFFFLTCGTRTCSIELKKKSHITSWTNVFYCFINVNIFIYTLTFISHFNKKKKKEINIFLIYSYQTQNIKIKL